jgi:hypothetical protein
LILNDALTAARILPSLIDATTSSTPVSGCAKNDRLALLGDIAARRYGPVVVTVAGTVRLLAGVILIGWWSVSARWINLYYILQWRFFGPLPYSIYRLVNPIIVALKKELHWFVVFIFYWFCYAWAPPRFYTAKTQSGHSLSRSSAAQSAI